MPYQPQVLRTASVTSLVAVVVWCLVRAPRADGQPLTTRSHHSGWGPASIPEEGRAEDCTESSLSRNRETGLCGPAEAPAQPRLMLANVYEQGIDLRAYWVSEKYDGGAVSRRHGVPRRAAPPTVGKVITFKHRGKTRRGVPRFASFLRVREDY